MDDATMEGLAEPGSPEAQPVKKPKKKTKAKTRKTRKTRKPRIPKFLPVEKIGDLRFKVEGSDTVFYLDEKRPGEFILRVWHRPGA